MTAAPRAGAAGFTLIELMISLGLFALIAVAGLGLVEGVMGVEGRTGRRLDRLADLQRAMFVVGSDLDQIAAGPMTGNAGGPVFVRAAPGLGGPPLPVRYALAGGALVRTAGRRAQPVLTDVATARWRYFDGGWHDRWPPDEARAATWPRAVEVVLELRGQGVPAGQARRVVTLPQPPVVAE